MEASRPTCPRCDAAIDATALFCARCGHQLLDTATPGAIRAGRRLLRLAHHLGGLLAVIARGIARLLLAFVGALLACLIVIVIGLGPATLVVGLDIGFVLFFVVFAWSGQLVFAPRFCAHCGQPLRAAIPARETRGRLRRAASRMARVVGAFIVAAFIFIASILVVFSGRVDVEFADIWPAIADIWPVTVSAMLLILLVSPSSRRVFAVLAGTGFVVVTGAAVIYFGRPDIVFGSWFWLTTALAAFVALLLLWRRPRLYRPLIRTRGRAAASVVVVLSLVAAENHALVNIDRSSICDPESAPPRSSRAAPADFSFVSASDAGLRALSASGEVLGKIVDLPVGYGGPRSPALLPDRRGIAFDISIDGPRGAGHGSDIWAVDIDGSNLRKLVEHHSPNVYYESPVVDPKGNFLYFYRNAPVNENGSLVGFDESIERLDLTTKQCTLVAPIHAMPLRGGGSIDLTIAPDGKMLVYTDFFGQHPKLWRIRTDGSDLQPFLRIGDTWAYVHAPSFAPDGATVAFSGAGYNAPVPCEAISCRQSELFIAAADGTAVRSVARIGDKNITWSLDGTRIAFVADGRLRILTVADGSVRSLTQSEYLLADILWVKDHS